MMADQQMTGVSSLKPQHKILPQEVTHLDLIKSFAVLVMIVDHIGYYFFPEQGWFRAIGRIGFPVWFFMIGYALSRELAGKLCVGALVLLAADIGLRLPIFPLNALFTIILLRLLIDPFVGVILRSRYIFWLSAILMALSYVFSNLITEYGTMALLFAVAGYLTRHRESVHANSFMTDVDYRLFMIFCVVSYCFLQTAQFNFVETQIIVISMSVAVMMFVLSNMRPMVFPKISVVPRGTVLKFMGRKTLEIYVAHLLLFKVIAVLLMNIGFYS